MKILLIDNSQRELLELKQALLKSRVQLAYVNSLNSAVSLLAKHKFTLVICNALLDERDGFSFIDMVAKKYPAMLRVLIEKEKSTEVIKCSAHQRFYFPINSQEIIATLGPLAKSHQAITKDVIIKAIANVKTLPSPPKVYMQLNAILKQHNTDSQKIAQIIQQDPALTAKVLQFTNNMFANANKPLMNIGDAITKMGLDTLCCIVMTAELFSYNPKIKDFSIVNEQLHSLATAKLAASMVKPALKQDAMIAGLLHDIGKVVLFEVDEKSTALYFKHLVKDANNHSLENKVFGSDHSHVGAYLLHTWGFSYDIIEALALHHRPSKLLKASFGIAQAVYLANALLHKQQPAQEFIDHYKLSGVLEALKTRAAKLM
jgi:putative nucleotidyltransferase with HDIG domain